MIAYNTCSIITDADLNLVEASDSYYDYVCSGQENQFLTNIHPDDQHLLYEMVEHLEKRGSDTLCFRMCRKHGEYAWVTSFCNRRNECEELRISIDIQDISSLSENDEKNHRDMVTGLLDKKAITEYAKKRCENPGNDVITLGILDIDNFKHINDSLGHSFGDKILGEVGKIIEAALGNDGKAGRIGGDEILLVIELSDEREYLRPILRNIRERVEKLHLDAEGYPMITVSIGTADFPTYVDNYQDLFNLADRMLYRAKNRGKNRYVMYNPGIHGELVNGVLSEAENKPLRSATPRDKTRLVLETLEGFFEKNDEATASVLAKIAATYDLDEVYIFYKGTKKSIYGFKKLEDMDHHNEKVSKLMEATSDISYALEPAFDQKLNANGVFVVDTPEKQIANCDKAKQFFEANDIKHAFVYKMQETRYKGYIAFYNTRELSRKYPQPDITDFTYLCKMIEIALKTR